MKPTAQLLPNDEEVISTPLYERLKSKFHDVYPSLANDDRNWSDIVNAANLMSVPANTVLMKPNTPCAQFLMLIDGCVRVYQQTPDDREATLYRNHGGDLCILTLNGLIHNKNFGAFAQSETPITVLAFSREQYMLALQACESFREYIMAGLTGRFQNAMELIEESVFQGLDTRLVCHLARLSRENKSDVLHVTHQELARELGSAREVVSRLLKNLERQGCIKLGRGEIHVTL